MDSSPPISPALKLASLVGLVLLLAHAVHTGLDVASPQLDGFFDQWVYNGLMVGAAVAIVARGVLVPGERLAWIALGIGVGCWATGDVVYSLFLADLADPPFPSVSDALFIAFYPAAYVALAILIKRSVAGFHLSLWVDALLGALAVSAVAAALLYDAVALTVAGDPLGLVATLAYPVGDVLLLALVVALFAITGWRADATWTMIAVALVVSAVGDATFLYQAANGTYTEHTLLDSVWPLSALLLAHAAWRPQRFHEARVEGLRILFMPTLLALTAVALIVVDQVHPLNAVALALACATLLTLIVRMAVTLRENLRAMEASRGEALTDSLTGLGNRRRLVRDLEEEIRAATAGDPRVLVLFDLDGFKRYNDTYGHLAGDALLARLGAKLAAAIVPYGRAYRLGGDEFCVVGRATPDDFEEFLGITAAALCERGEQWEVESSYGAVVVPHEADVPSMALQLADQRMYARKDARSSPVLQQTREVLMRALQARRPEMRESSELPALAATVARRLGVAGEALDEIARAAELHDVGKVAVPDAILGKAETLTDDEWAFMRRHTILGERILNGAAAMRPIARLVRSTHERFDGTGYPDGLAGEEIPLGARIVAVCDAYAAMTSERPYRAAMGPEDACGELRLAAGTQFDPRVVAAFVEELAARARRGETPESASAVEGPTYVQEVAEHLRDAVGQDLVPRS